MGFPFFGKKDDAKPAAPGAPAAAPTKDDDKPQFSAERAQKFFQHAKTAHDSTNYSYATKLWLDGLRWDPHSMTGLEGFFAAAQSHLNDHPKGFDKEILKSFSATKTDVDKLLNALIEWANARFLEPVSATRAAEAAAKLDLAEPTHRIGTLALKIVAADKKGRKDLLLKLLEAFKSVGAFDKAVEAGEAALKVDPADGPLSAAVKNLAAQSTMSLGGYDKTGQSGGFRANVKDLDRQRQLEDADKIVKTEDTVDRLVSEAQADFNSRPHDTAALTVYIKRLLERGKDDDEKRARDLAAAAYEKTREFRFREMVSDINLKRKGRIVNQYRDAAANRPADPKAQETYKLAREQLMRFEIEEFKLRAEAYPTDMKWRYEVAKRLFELGDADGSIPLLQECASDAKLRVETLHMLAQAFLKIDYIDESIHASREAIDTHKLTTDERGMALNYTLMIALQAKAERERDLPAIVEADKIASAIGLQQFSYRDIRQRREAIKKLLAELKSAAAS